MFKVDKAFAVPMPKLFEDDNCEVYQCIELALNIYLFILEYTVEVEDECSITRRVMFNNIIDILEIVPDIKIYEISLFAPRYTNINKEMSISTILEVIKCDDGNQTIYKYKCKNGTVYIDPLPWHKEPNFENGETIYSKS